MSALKKNKEEDKVQYSSHSHRGGGEIEVYIVFQKSGGVPWCIAGHRVSEHNALTSSFTHCGGEFFHMCCPITNHLRWYFDEFVFFRIESVLFRR